jgi:hypothetical protein
MGGNGFATRTKGGKSLLTGSSLKILGLVVVTIGMLGLGCNQVGTVYWSKPGADDAKLQEDKEECQSLQRAVGLNEERFEKCLEAQGWSKVRQEKESAAPISE